MIIIGVFDGPYKIGEIVRGIYELRPDENYSATFLVLEKATKEDWLEYRKENKLPITYNYNHPEALFYKVTTD